MMDSINTIGVVFITSIVSLVSILAYKHYAKWEHTETNNVECEPKQKEKEARGKKLVPVAVNYHFTRKCNYECGFCFHTSKTSYIMDLEKAKEGIRMLKENGMRKLNFAGGEPFLYPKFLGELVKFSKETLKIESVSIISNGSRIKEDWFKKYAEYLDILGISCDSFDETINTQIGRGKGEHVKNIFKIRELCYEYNIKFKLNTVVCSYNHLEDMNESIARIDPFRWKCFQCLIVKSENDGSNEAIRNASRFLITDDQYNDFIKRHEDQKSLIKEPNEIMKSSYLILDEYMRFLDKGNDDEYITSESIFDIGVQRALEQINWNEQAFEDRQGEYDWSKETFNETNCSGDKNLEW